MNDKDVTVGIVTFNDDLNLSRLLQRLKNQSRPFQIIVVDGADHAETAGVCRPFAATYIGSRVNDIGLNRKKIVESCTTSMLAFIDTDCLPPTESWLADMVEKLGELRERDETAAGYGGGQIFCDDQTTTPSILNLYADPLFSFGSPQFADAATKRVDHLPTNNAIFFTSMLKECGNFISTPFNIGEDLALGWQLTKKGFSLYKSSHFPVCHLAKKEGWLKKMYGYGRAQSFALKKVKTRPPARYWLCAGFLPSAVGLLICHLPVFFLFSLLFVITAVWFHRGKYTWYRRLKFSLGALAGYFLYSAGLWRELFLGRS